MLIGAFRTVITLILSGLVGTAAAQTLPTEVLRPEPTVVVLRYSGELKPNPKPKVKLVISIDRQLEVNAEVTEKEVVVSLSPEVSDDLDAVGQTIPVGAPLLVIDELTISDQIQQNLIAAVPVDIEVQLLTNVTRSTVLDVYYMPVAHRKRSESPDAWVVKVDEEPFSVSNVRTSWAANDPLCSGDPALQLTIEGVIPNGAKATISFLEQLGGEPRLLASGTTSSVSNDSGNANIYTGFTFTDSKGKDSTFGVIVDFQSPFLLTQIIHHANIK